MLFKDQKRDQNLRPGRPTDYWTETQHLQSFALGSFPDIVFRYCLIIAAFIALYLENPVPFYWVWFVAYFSTNILYLVILHFKKPPMPFSHYAGLCALNMITSGIFAVLPVYIWITSENPALKALALCGLAGHGMYNLARHRRFTPIAVWDTFTIMASIGVVAVFQIMQTPGFAGKVCVAVGTLAIMVYYAIAQYATIRDREALANSREETLEAMKLSAMGQITAGVAHDFNNKLTVIQGNIDLATMTHDPTYRAERLAEARAATEHAAEVVALMRAFVRKSPLSLTTIKLDAFSTHLGETIQKHLPENISLALHVDESLPQMETDPALLETALLNLSLNARDAMAEAGGLLEVRISTSNADTWTGRAPEADGPYIRFDVRDTGAGLPMEQFAYVQEPFYTTKPTGTGTGLGLSMVKGFTEQLGGALLLQNRRVGGLEVSMLLPVNAHKRNR